MSRLTRPEKSRKEKLKEEKEAALQNALRDINSGKMSQAAASKVY